MEHAEYADDELAQVLHYGEAELAANRDGKLTQDQRRRLWIRDSLQLALSFTLVAGGLAYTVLEAVGAPPLANPGRIRALGLAAVGLGLIFGWLAERVWVDLVRGQVLAVHGLLTRDIVGGYRTTRCVFEIGDMKFQVSRRAFEAATEGETTVYYLPRSKHVLSLEPVKPNPSFGPGTGDDL